MSHALLHDDAALLTLLRQSLPVCVGADATMEWCGVREVITGRRGKLFALVDIKACAASPDAHVPLRLTLHFYPEDAVEEGRKVYRRIRRQAGELGKASDLRPWSTYLRDARLLVLPFPFDYRLPMLTQAIDPLAVSTRRAELGLGDGALSLTPVRYVPEKRCQIRFQSCEAGGTTRTVYGKVVTGDGAVRVEHAMRRLHAWFTNSRVAGTPEPVGYVADWRMLVQRGVPGCTVYDLQRRDHADADLYRRLGVALAELHAAPLDDLDTHTVDAELTLLDGMLGKGVLAAADQARADALLALLRQRQGTCPDADLVTTHRDFYDKQVLSDARRLWIIDLDTLARAPRALDAGNFVAHLQLRVRQGYLAGSLHARARLAFIEGYGGHRVDAATLGWWTAAALLRLAVVYAVRPAWSHLSPRLLDDASAALAGAAHELVQHEVGV